MEVVAMPEGGQVKIKDADVRIKAGPEDGLAEGQFTAYASVFGNRDSYGDVVLPGAFADTLTEWKASGAPIPLLWGHNLADPDFNIGEVTDANEDDKGLLITAQIDMESPKAVQTYRLLKGRRVRQMSFAYDVEDGAEAADGGSYELKKLKLYEVSVVPIGANQETEILAVKAAEELARGAKEGRVLAAKHIDSLRDAQKAIAAVIKAADGGDQEKASTTSPAKDDSPDQAKSDEPSTDVSVDDLADELLNLEIEGASL